MTLITNAYHAAQQTAGQITFRFREFDRGGGEVPKPLDKQGRNALDRA